MFHDKTVIRFDAYVKAAMRYSLFRLRKRRNRIMENECSDGSSLEFACETEYDFLENHIQVLNFNLTIKNDLLYELLSALEQRQRDILYLSVCENLSDFKIAGMLNMSRSAVQRLRVKTNRTLQMKLEVTKNGSQRKTEVDL